MSSVTHSKPSTIRIITFTASVNSTSLNKECNGLPRRPYSHHLCIGRDSEPGRAYLITAVVHNQSPLFANWQLGRLLAVEMRQAHEQGQVDSLAWVIMPDHFHWLFQLHHRHLSRVVGSVKSRSTLTINQATRGYARFWQSGYHDRAIRDGENLRDIARYLVANPLRAGLVEQIGDYPLWDAIWL